MENQISIPKWQVKYKTVFPNQYTRINNNIPKVQSPQIASKSDGINPWVVLGVAVAIGVTVYVLWKRDQDTKRKTERA